MLPTASQIYGATIDALDVGYFVPSNLRCLLCDRGAHRFFKEGRSSEVDCCRITTLALGLTNGSLFPTPRMSRATWVQYAHVLAALLYRNAAIWDEQVVPFADEADRRAFVRLATITVASVAALADHAVGAHHHLLRGRGALMTSLRQERGWTIDQMTDVLGVSRNSVINWCTGKHAPGTDNLLRIARRLAPEGDLLLLHRLRRHYAIHALEDMLAEVYDAHAIDELWHVYREVHACRRRMLAQQERGEIGAYLFGAYTLLSWSNFDPFMRKPSSDGGLRGARSSWHPELSPSRAAA